MSIFSLYLQFHWSSERPPFEIESAQDYRTKSLHIKFTL